MSIDGEQAFAASFAIGGDVNHAAVSADLGRIAAAFGDKVTIVDVACKKAANSVTAPGSVNDLAIVDGAVYAVTNRCLLFVHADAGSREVKIDDEGTAVAVVNGFALIGTKRGALLKVDLASGKTVATSQISSSKVTKVVVDRQGKQAAVGSSNGLLSVYSLADDKVVSEDLKYHNMPITAIAISDDGRSCLTAAHERDVHAWDLAAMKHVAVYDSSLV